MSEHEPSVRGNDDASEVIVAESPSQAVKDAVAPTAPRLAYAHPWLVRSSSPRSLRTSTTPVARRPLGPSSPRSPPTSAQLRVTSPGDSQTLLGNSAPTTSPTLGHSGLRASTPSVDAHFARAVMRTSASLRTVFSVYADLTGSERFMSQASFLRLARDAHLSSRTLNAGGLSALYRSVAVGDGLNFAGLFAVLVLIDRAHRPRHRGDSGAQLGERLDRIVRDKIAPFMERNKLRPVVRMTQQELAQVFAAMSPNRNEHESRGVESTLASQGVSP
jgi:hypothetical protein